MPRFSDFFKTILLAMTMCLATQFTYGQVDSSLVVVHVDYRADLLAKKKSQINKLSVYKNSAGQYKGYRVMIINTNNRDLAYKMRGDVLRYFPNQAVYMAYQAPYFKLKAGDFIKREDAEKFRKELSKYFTESFFIVSDIIKISPEEEARLLAEQEAKQY
ncbi:MAG TPA: SPOR domain-containing protein [Phnomibacter sp.]|nr:SPOR domain-containing protein [Phnomibacter sp.]